MKREEAMELATNGFEELSQALAAGKSESLTAYLEVMARVVGLDATTHASDYIQLYQGDTETLEESMHFIQQASATIIEALNRVELAEQLESMVRQPETAELRVAR